MTSFRMKAVIVTLAGFPAATSARSLVRRLHLAARHTLRSDMIAERGWDGGTVAGQPNCRRN
jgi:hypothetical protein